MLSFDRILSRRDACSCGRTHQTLTREILVEPGLLARLPGLLEKYTFQSFLVICDDHTEGVAGGQIARLMNCEKVVLPSKGLHATEKAVALTEESLAPLPKPDCLIAVGSGTIHDITRYLAQQMGIEFISVPTAASVDGFVSTVAAMTWFGVKKTMPARAPVAVYADLDIIASAPFRLTAAGFGDMVGKYTALADWRIAHLLTGEFLCEETFALEEEAVRQTLSCADSLKKQDPAGVRVLMEGLLLSGVAMQMMGNSRPASGSEHHVSHFIEMLLEDETPKFLHGEKVGAATVALSKLYHTYAANPVSITSPSLPTRTELEAVFGRLTDGIEVENRDKASLLVKADRYQQVLPQIVGILRGIPSAEELSGLLSSLGCPSELSEIGIPESDQTRLMRYVPYARARLTMLRILADFRLL